MTRGIVLMGLVAALAGCGSSETEAAPPTTATPPGTPAVAPGTPTPAPAPTPAGGTASNFGTISLNAGFMPDPHVARGTSGGATDASTVNASCAGWISGTPDHIFQAGTAFPSVRLMAASDQDVTLVIQKPDNTYLCNDDTDGTNPVVDIQAAQPGTYRVWIGSYQQGVNAPYRLGVTELPATLPSTLPQ
jgi:hypothetical protein